MHRNYFYCLKSFYVLISVMYLPGLFFFPFFSEAYSRYFNYSGHLYSYFFIVFTTFCILVFISFLIIDKLPFLKIRTLKSRLTISFISFVIFLYFIFSLYFFINFSSSFRHQNRLSDAGGIVTALFFLKPLIYFLVALMLIHILNGNVLGKVTKLLLLLILVSTILFLNSSLQFIVIPIILIMLFSPHLLVIKLNKIKFRYVFGFIFLVPLFLFAVIFIGVGNKVGYEFLLSETGFYYLKGFGNILFPRLSTSLFSSVILFEYYLQGFSYSDKVIDGISSTLFNRLSLLFPFDNFNSDIISTINRLNYLTVFNSESGYAARAGASPGIISSVFYMPYFPFTIFLIPIYIALIFKAIKYHMGPNLKMNTLSMLILPYLILSLFEAPLNIFYIIDPEFFLFFTIIVLSRLINVENVFSK